MGVKRKARLLNGAASAVVAALCFAVTAPALAQEARYTFDIPAQDLDAALKAFGRTTKLQLVYDGRKVRHLRSYAVKGEFSARDGLAQLLEGSGFTMRVGQSGVLIVESAAHATSTQPGNAGAGDGAAAADDRGIADILVIGSKSQNSDVRRNQDDPQPYVVFDHKDIEASQAATLEDFFRTRLTSNTVQGSESQRTSGTRSSAIATTRSTINLRGLGANQTLILVDGRRLGDLSIQNPAVGAVNTTGQPDINGIPLASIERIEVLSSTAGGIYGGNAVGGVVNIILRHDYRGLEITLNDQDTGDFKYPIRRLDATGGFALEGGKTNITFGGSYTKAGVLRVGERSFSQKGFDLGYKNYPELYNPAAGQLGFPTTISRGTNIFSDEQDDDGNPVPLTLKPRYGGNAIGGLITNVPVGFKGSPTDLGAALTNNAGKFDYEQPLGNAGRQRSLVASPETQSFNVNVRRKFNDWLDVYGDFSRFGNKGSGFSATRAPENIGLGADALNNPFNQAIRVEFDNGNLATRYRGTTVENRATAGLALHLPHKWAVGFDYTWNWSKSKSSYYSFPLDSVGGSCAIFGISPANVGDDDPNTQCPTKFSVAGDTRPVIDLLNNPDFTPYILSSPNARSVYRTSLQTPALRLSGPLFDLPGGAVNFAGNVLRNTQRTKRGYSEEDFFTNTKDATPFESDFLAFAPAEQRSTSVFGELRIPLFSAANARPLLHDLSLQGSVRHDSYKTTAYNSSAGFSEASLDDAATQFGTARQSARNRTTNYTVALEYAPIKDIIFRGSYGTGYTEPTVNEVATNITKNNYGFQDPRRGNTSQDEDYTLITGGLGLDFKPETSKSYSFGVILKPSFVPGDLRLSADYSRIKKRNEITFLPVDDLFNNPDRYPGRLVRAPLTGTDTALGYTGGIITSLNLTDINLFKSSVTSVDFNADYVFTAGKAGVFRIYAIASWEPELHSQVVVDAPRYSFAGAVDGPLKWRGNGGIEWTKNGLQVQYNAQYYGSYRVYSPYESEDDVAFDVQLQGSNRIRRQIYHDIYVSYALPASSGLLHGIRLSAGVQNLFNTSPPILASFSFSQGGYSGYGDPRLRRFTLTLRKAFGN